MTRRTIAVLSDINPSGGGSHQWALNILFALDDYRNSRGEIDVVLMHYDRYEGGHPVATLFPHFTFARVSQIGGLVARVMRRTILFAPWLLPALRPFFPLNRVASRHEAQAVVFPLTRLDSLFCDRPNLFCMADIAHIYYPHFPEVKEGNGLRLRYVLFQYGLANADVVMVETAHLRREITRHYGVNPAKVHVVAQVLPRVFVNANHPDSGIPMPQPYLFYPAQLWAHKNHLNLLSAFAELAADFPDLHLVLSGSRKSGDQAIFDRIKVLGLEDRVHYLGYVPDEHMPQLYRKAVALVMPTFFGPSNIPTLEAFAFGCPAVISDLPGVAEQVRDAALLFDPSQPADIAAKLRQVLEDNTVADRLISAGRRRIAELSYENFRDDMFSLFDAVLQPRR